MLFSLISSAAGARLSLVLTEDGGADEISAAVDLKCPLNTGLKLEEISGRGEGRLKASFVPGSPGNEAPGAQLALEADLAVVCGRGKPAYDIPYQLGANLTLQPNLGGFALPRPDESESGASACLLPGGSHLIAVGEACGDLPGRHYPSANEEDKP